MQISILTLFPQMFTGPFNYSILQLAQEKKLLRLNYINIRDFGIGKHKQVDDTPYGGGVGMVMRVDVLHKALHHAIQHDDKNIQRKIVLLSAKGQTFTQKKANTYSTVDHLVLICGHYEGVDERIVHFIDEEVSIGNYVLTGGEIPAMVITDSVSRLVQGVLKPDATAHESFSLTDKKDGETLLEYPQYTRPDVYETLEVPSILREGNHALIDQWRLNHAMKQSSSSKD